MKKRMKKGYIFLPVLLLVSLNFLACVSLKVENSPATEKETRIIERGLTTEFVSYQFFHIWNKKNLQEKAYYKLLEAARAKHGNNVDIRDIEIKGGFSPFELINITAAFLMGIPGIGIPGGIILGELIYQADEKPYEMKDKLIWGGAGLAIGLVLSGNTQRITATGVVVSPPPPPAPEPVKEPEPLTVSMLDDLGEFSDYKDLPKNIDKVPLQLYLSSGITLEWEDKKPRADLKKGGIIITDELSKAKVNINEKTEGKAIAMRKNGNGIEIDVRFEEDTEYSLLFRSDTAGPDEKFYLFTGEKGTLHYGEEDYKLNFTGGRTPHLLVKYDRKPVNKESPPRTASGVRVY